MGEEREGRPYFERSKLIWRAAEISPGERLTLLALNDHADQYGESCHPGQDTLAYMTGYDRRTVSRHLDSLKEKAIVWWVTNGHKHHGGATNDYRIIFDQLEQKQRPKKRRKACDKLTQPQGAQGCGKMSQGLEPPETKDHKGLRQNDIRGCDIGSHDPPLDPPLDPPQKIKEDFSDSEDENVEPTPPVNPQRIEPPIELEQDDPVNDDRSAAPTNSCGKKLNGYESGAYQHPAAAMEARMQRATAAAKAGDNWTITADRYWPGLSEEPELGRKLYGGDNRSNFTDLGLLGATLHLKTTPKFSEGGEPTPGEAKVWLSARLAELQRGGADCSRAWTLLENAIALAEAERVKRAQVEQVRTTAIAAPAWEPKAKTPLPGKAEAQGATTVGNDADLDKLWEQLYQIDSRCDTPSEKILFRTAAFPVIQQMRSSGLEREAIQDRILHDMVADPRKAIIGAALIEYSLKTMQRHQIVAHLKEKGASDAYAVITGQAINEETPELQVENFCLPKMTPPFIDILDDIAANVDMGADLIEMEALVTSQRLTDEEVATAAEAKGINLPRDGWRSVTNPKDLKNLLDYIGARSVNSR